VASAEREVQVTNKTERARHETRNTLLCGLLVFLVFGAYWYFAENILPQLDTPGPDNSAEMATSFAEVYYGIEPDACQLCSFDEVVSSALYKTPGRYLYETYYLVDFDIENGALFLRDFYVGVCYGPSDSSYFRVTKNIALQEWNELTPV
jgi:hypothetical protein